MPCWRLPNYEDEEDEVDVDKYSYIDGESTINMRRMAKCLSEIKVLGPCILSLI